ncbi:hypothetical protein Tco_0877798, partial [Tanacetum coccineum]
MEQFQENNVVDGRALDMVDIQVRNRVKKNASYPKEDMLDGEIGIVADHLDLDNPYCNK